MNAPRQLDPARRRALTQALQERARLLQLPAELIERSVARCTPRGASGRMEVPVPAPTAAATVATVAPVVVSSGTAPVAAAEPSPAAEPAAIDTSPTVLSQNGSGAEMPVTATALGEATEGTGRWMPILPGRIIAGYRIEEQIGKGAMGRVFRATQLSMNRMVAFKVLAPKLAGSPRFRERFLREARAAGRLHHPNLIAVHDVGEADGLMFFSMELVDGTTLKDLIAKHGRTPEVRALEIVRQTLEGLKYAHAAGVVHRDIKPENLMLTKAGMVKVADLGLSRSDGGDEEDAFTTQSGAIMGTPHYMSPEQGRDAHRADHRADLYAVGATLYHLVCGQPPFTGESAMEVVIRAASQPLRFPEPGPSPGVRVAISRLMAKKPEDRPQTAAEAIELVTQLRREKRETDPDHQDDAANAIARARGRRLRRTMRRGLWVAFAFSVAAVIVLFLLGVIGAYNWRQLQYQVGTLCEGHRYQQAQTALDLYHGGINPFVGRASDIARIQGEVAKQWDSWAFLQAKPLLDAFHDHLRGHRLAEAYAALNKIEDEWRSPGVRHDQDDCQRQWEEAMLKAEAQPERGDNPNKARELWPQEYLNHLGAELWTSLGAQPADTVAIKENVARFTGTGSGTIRLPASGPRLKRMVLRFTTRLMGKDVDERDAWGIQFPGGNALLLTRRGLVLRGGEPGERVLVEASAAPVITFTLRQAEKSWEVQAGEAGDWLPLAASQSQLPLQWKLSGDRAVEARLRPSSSLRREDAPR